MGTGKVTRRLEPEELTTQIPKIFKGLSKISNAYSEIKNKNKHSHLFGKNFLLPRIGTSASEDFFKTLSQISQFNSFLLHLVTVVEHVYSLIDSMTTLPSGGRIEAIDREKGTSYGIDPPCEAAIKEFHENRHFLQDVLHVRIIENYLTYLSSLLFEIFVQRPETMKSEEKIDIETVLSNDSLKGLIRVIAEKKISSLSYDSFKGIYKYFKTKFNLNVCKETHIGKIVEVIEIRNIIVHNRSIIDENFIRRTGNDPALKGTCIVPTFDCVRDTAHILSESVKTLDLTARRKLKLKGRRFKKATVTK
ncbi:MAG: hypothetical protein C4550_03700 [Nitrospiraceae bacterium]|nr:MAG: hypothetical protein C4550_03700 [Nitrospiraceae bacterium]